MECTKATGFTLKSTSGVSSTHSSSPQPLSHAGQVVITPCAACKALRRRCVEKCVLAPYFPPPEQSKFIIAHRIFGASNIIKLLQDLPESQRADAVSSMVYEATARIRDPVYGCAGAICQLQKQVNELQAQLAKAQAELVNMQLQQEKMAVFYMEMAGSAQLHHFSQDSMDYLTNSNVASFFEENSLGSMVEPLWT